MKREILTSLRVLACIGPLLAGTVAVAGAQDLETNELKSPGTATLRSFLGTAAPIAVAYARGGDLGIPLWVGGVIFGPVLGYVYADDTKRGLAGAAKRAAVMGGTIAAVAGICSLGCDIFGSNDDGTGLAVGVAALGALTILLLTGNDIIQAGERLRARNDGLAAVSVQPTYFPKSRTAGLQFTWRH